MGSAAARQLRVAHLIGTLNIGGAENQVVMLVNALDANQFERHVITMAESVCGFRPLLDAEVKYCCIAYRRRNAPISLLRLYRYLRKHRIDVLHCHMYHAAVKGALIGRLARVPVIIVSEHGKNTWKRWFDRLLERVVVSRWSALRAAVSEDIRRLRIEQDGVDPESIIIMPNAVETRFHHGIDLARRPRKLGSLGRLVDAKDFVTLFRAVRLLLDRGCEVSLEIAGEGVERDKLERAREEMGLTEVVTLPGVKNGNDFLSSIDMFVMSSVREGVPVALLEAMAKGLPIVATSVGGIPEVLENECEGLLCPPGDPKALADNIGRLMDDPALRSRMGSAARKKVVERYGIEGISKKWTELYFDKVRCSEGGRKT